MIYLCINSTIKGILVKKSPFDKIECGVEYSNFYSFIKKCYEILNDLRLNLIVFRIIGWQNFLANLILNVIINLYYETIENEYYKSENLKN